MIGFETDDVYLRRLRDRLQGKRPIPTVCTESV